MEKGHSIEWQERFVQKVEMAIEAADRGEFASQSDVDWVLNKYRPG